MQAILGYDPHMSLGGHLKQWCQFRNMTLPELAKQTGISTQTLESLQDDSLDVSVSIFATIAESLKVPMAWLHYDPHILQQLWNEADEDSPALPHTSSFDPLFQQMIQVSREHPTIIVLLTSILHHGDAKLIRAAQVSLQSLAKQIRPTTVPWGSRPPGHFEPPSD